ncbi:hypothetical protein B6U79_04190 [Candidatus Bathyarchaeota archaeon ex4484_231]|nr:MAG: hypothetical protein B6U79_04190 [Candidatus Bathyarchaeota archaeon ex4484_231]RJS75197.1 MAG: hypothetical protein CW712_05185 [Candidatus Bathyarchaeota archaeon]
MPEEDEANFDYTSIFQEKEIDDAKAKDMSEKFGSLLKVITEDARQLSEYLVAESSMVTQICGYLKNILSELDLSISLSHKAVPEFEKCKEIILNPECHLIAVKKDGSVESRSLKNYPPETILMVVWELMPKLREEVSLYMKRVSVRLNFLEMINEELKNIQRPFGTSQEKPVSEFQEDKVKEILIPQSSRQNV